MPPPFILEVVAPGLYVSTRGCNEVIENAILEVYAPLDFSATANRRQSALSQIQQLARINFKALLRERVKQYAPA